MTIREAISLIKKEIREVNADSRLHNKFIYSKLIAKSNILIQRDADALKLGSLQDLYQTIKCAEVEEVPAIDPNCFISSDLKLYRTCKLPDLYSDFSGVLIKSVRSVDRFGKDIKLESVDYIVNLREDTNSRFDKSIYGFYEDGRIYLEKNLPIRIEGMYVADISSYKGCNCGEKDEDCIRFLDTKWYIPRKLEDDVISLVIRDLGGGYKRIPEQAVINKDPNT